MSKGKLIFEIRRQHEGFGEGLYLYVNGGCARGFPQVAIITNELSEDSIIEDFKEEVALFDGHLIGNIGTD